MQPRCLHQRRSSVYGHSPLCRLDECVSIDQVLARQVVFQLREESASWDLHKTPNLAFIAWTHTQCESVQATCGCMLRSLAGLWGCHLHKPQTR